ncbi:UDP-N-acetylmuramoyl-L-alanine--D-glutamate ligase [Sulfurimonas sp.]|uniref:UDP-N-acetylmuramoyl-L-alanine--D-glutamate ligase n=1 Tax=Sulfurimonas sp. TaxID=2022749 RepID=UPI002B47E3EB|nr:UDP-N-acetylmuramoyl-L-alanine--D-glutamate ligase [Sulfurimonas sp.]
MQKISLFGYGRTTKAIAKVAINAVFYDDKCTKPFRDSNGFKVNPSSEFNAKYSSLEIPSPGISPSNSLIKKAKNLISEYDYFNDTPPLKIWISGTNGKTTTTQMMQHLLKDKGSQAGGNIGTPLAELSIDAKVWILETSSFTMHYTNIARPNIYVLLPIHPDHLSWHGSMKEYEDAKLKPLLSMQEGEIAIVPHKYKDIKTNAHIISYEDENSLAEHFDINIKKVNFKGAFLADAILGMAVDKILFDRIDYTKINSFKLDPHRQEELKDSKNRLWVNDTKATNIDATKAALNRYKDLHIHLILGGDDKGVELDELFQYLINIDASIYTIGSNKDKLFALGKKHKINSKKCLNLTDAISKIDAVLNINEVALLSPAASSLDEFSSYAKRGNEFKKAVKNIS